MAKLLSIGQGTKPTPEGYPWPYEVSISYDDPDYPIALSEGAGHAAAGSVFRAEEILHPRWQEHLSICNCEWLVTVVRQAQDAGVKVTPAMLEAAWRAAG